jgi:hypothetical protein
MTVDELPQMLVHSSLHPPFSGAVTPRSDYLVTSPPTMPTETMVSILETLKVPSSFLAQPTGAFPS